ncbi:MAG TPA: hypothetical protein VLA44_02720, partial [Clostridia bacterium]|nr:hypothetical protein [Clostridia bacterium]
ADAPIVAQELRLRAAELLAAFAATPGGTGIREVRVRVRRADPRVSSATPASHLGASDKIEPGSPVAAVFPGPP